MTEVTLFYADPAIAWYQTATSLTGYLWCVQNGQIVGGSQDEPVAAIPGQTGNTLTDITAWLSAAVLELMGGAPAPDAGYNYPIALATEETWGIDAVLPAEGFNNRPFAALAYTGSFTFGDLNIPPNVNGTQAEQRHWFFAISSFGTPATISPAFNSLSALIADGVTHLRVLEANQA